MTSARRFDVRVHASPHHCAAWPTLMELDAFGGGAFAFQARDFLAIWAATIGAERGTDAHFVEVADNGTPFMLLPLGIEHRRGLRILSFLDGGVADYQAPILFSHPGALGPDSVAALWTAIMAALPPFDFAHFERMPAEIGGIPNPLAALATGRDERSSHVIDLRGSWDAYAEHGLPRQQDMRRKRRRLSEVGPIRFEIAETGEEATRLLSSMMAQKAKQYVETLGEDSFDRAGYRLFYPAMTDEFARSGRVHLSALRVGDEIVATHWGLVAAGRFYFLMPSTESGEWRRYSPGRLLIEELIAWCFREGLRCFDFGPGNEPYKLEYATASIPLLKGKVPASLRGHAIDWLARSPAGPMLKSGRDWVAARVARRKAP